MNKAILAAVACLFVAPLFAQEPLKVGVIAPFSGPFADYGRQFEGGIKAFMKLNGATLAENYVGLPWDWDAAGRP